MLAVWKVRIIPRPGRCQAGKCSTRSPLTEIEPSWMASSPESRFTRVLFPDPFGPIRP